jgi:hypothetical protein
LRLRPIKLVCRLLRRGILDRVRGWYAERLKTLTALAESGSSLWVVNPEVQ